MTDGDDPSRNNWHHFVQAKFATPARTTKLTTIVDGNSCNMFVTGYCTWNIKSNPVTLGQRAGGLSLDDC